MAVVYFRQIFAFMNFDRVRLRFYGCLTCFYRDVCCQGATLRERFPRLRLTRG